MTNAHTSRDRTPHRGRRVGRALLTAAVVLAFALPGLVPAASAQERPEAGAPDPQEALTRIERHYSAEVAGRVREMIQRAGEAGVPAGPVVNKALEGAAKAVPADRLLPVMEDLTGRLVRSRSLLGPRATTGSVVAGAGALRQGVPGEMIRAVGQREGDTAIPLVVLGELSAAGVPVDRALGLVEEALGRGQGGQQLLNMGAAVRQLVARGQPPGQAASAVRDAVRQGRPPSSVPGVGNLPDGPPGKGGGRPGGGPGG